MNGDRSPLDGLHVEVPCHVSWDSMRGDDRVRFCGQCRLNVYHLSGMTRADAEALIRKKEGKLCVRFFRRRDGTGITRDCSTLIGAVRYRLEWAFAALAALVPLWTGCAPRIQGTMSLTDTTPLERAAVNESQPAYLVEVGQGDTFELLVVHKGVSPGRLVTVYQNGTVVAEGVVEVVREEVRGCRLTCRTMRGEIVHDPHKDVSVWIERADYRGGGSAPHRPKR